MKLAAPFFSITCLLLSLTAHAQLYKSVGANGKVTYSDTPPTTGKVTPHNLVSENNDGDTSGLPYELAQAAKNMPVILYSADKCAPCDQGRQFLQSRGIPFTEKTVNSDSDIKRLHEINSGSSNAQVPLLLIGRNKENGFSASNWGTALNAAGYPQNSQLPKDYRNGQISTAGTASPTPATPKNTNAADNHKAHTFSGKSAPAAGNAPPGFQF